MLHTISRNADLADQAMFSAAASSTGKRPINRDLNDWSKLLRTTALFPAHDALDQQTQNASSKDSDDDEPEGEGLGEADSQSEEQIENDDDDSDEEQAESLEKKNDIGGNKSKLIGTRDAPQYAPQYAPLHPPPRFHYDAHNTSPTIKDQLPD